MNNKFNNLPEEKRLKIINGALNVFSKYDYKKATMDEIAKSAGISKALLFHYFNSKHELYIDIYRYGIAFMQEILDKSSLEKETDFFSLMRKSIRIKIDIARTFPSLTDFVIKAYYETHTDVAHDITEYNMNKKINAVSSYFNNIDMSKFKDDIPLEMAFNTIIWVSDGYMSSKKYQGVDTEAIYSEYNSYIDLYEKLFYKEEYINGSNQG